MTLDEQISFCEEKIKNIKLKTEPQTFIDIKNSLEKLRFRRVNMIFGCKHKYEVTERSNALQFDDMGYPLRLCIVKCAKCGKTEQQWLDTYENAYEEVKRGESFAVKWRKNNER